MILFMKKIIFSIAFFFTMMYNINLRVFKHLINGVIMAFDITKLKWTNEPKEHSVTADKIEIITQPRTDLWQRTYYKFRNDNAPVLQMQTDEKEFSFHVKADFDSYHNFDQAGIAVYLNSENWIKASVEYGDEKSQFLGAVVTNNGFSDWSTTSIPADIKTIWFRLSRRGDDFCVESSYDGIDYQQLRICHLFEAGDTISFGVYACSPEEASFKAVFTEFEMTQCRWPLHTGQQPDEDL